MTALREAEAMVSLTAITEELPSFAYAVSHDFQSPLRHIHQHCDILAEELGGHADKSVLNSLGVLQASSATVRRLIESLLEYSRINTRAEKHTLVDMQQLAENVYNSLQDTIAEYDATVQFDQLPNVVADADQINQVMLHLVENAIRYCGPEKPRVKITGVRQGDTCEYSVTDNGIGIDEDYRDDVFTIFRRLGEKPDVQGRGMGLALSRRIITRHGGRIWLTSEVGVGSTFSFTLPVHVED